VMQLEYKGKKEFLRTFRANDPWPDQPNVSGTIRRLTRDSIPNVTFITGHYERSPWRNGEREFGSHTNYKVDKLTLINLGVNTDTVSLLQSDIPDSTNLLVIADPRSALNYDEQQKVMQYLNKGGNAIFYAEPGKQQMLNPILNQMSVNIDSGILVSPRKHKEGATFKGLMNREGNYMAREKMMQLYQQFGKIGASASFSGSSTVSFLEKDGFKIEPIVTVRGNKNTWMEKGVFVSDSAAPLFVADEGDLRKEEYVLAVKMSRKINNKEQRIVVAGDADFMSPDQMNGMSIGTGLYSWLLNNEYPVYTKLIFPTDTRLTIGKSAGRIIWYVYVYIIPGLLLALGAIIIIRRIRK
jgi:ABC-2 type transport system permease protein